MSPGVRGSPWLAFLVAKSIRRLQRNTKPPQRDTKLINNNYNSLLNLCFQSLPASLPSLSPCSRWEKAGQVSREVWEKAGEQGLLGIMAPEKHGGIGGDLFSAAVMWEEQ